MTKATKAIKKPFSSLNRELKRYDKSTTKALRKPMKDLKESVLPDAPEPPPPVRTSNIDSDEVRARQSRAAQRKYSSRGRQGTSLSSNSTNGLG